jgi:hypothetical protein
MGRRASKAQKVWASIKLHRRLVAWLKVEAARRSVFMGDLVEEKLALALSDCAPGTADYPPPWNALPDVYLDRVHGNDANTGATIGSPIKTMSEAVRRYGSSMPILVKAQNLTIHLDGKARKVPRDWAVIKLRRPLVARLKIEAAKRGVFMGDLVEEMLARAFSRTPSRRPKKDRDLTDWYIDPQNATTCASDTNSSTSATRRR